MLLSYRWVSVSLTCRHNPEVWTLTTVKTQKLICSANVNRLYSLLLTINKHVSKVVIMLKNHFLSQSINLEKMTSVDHLA